MKIKIKLSSGKELELSAEEYKEVQDFFTTKEVESVPYIPYTPYIPWNQGEPFWYGVNPFVTKDASGNVTITNATITTTEGMGSEPIIMEAVNFPHTGEIHIYNTNNRN